MKSTVFTLYLISFIILLLAACTTLPENETPPIDYSQYDDCFSYPVNSTYTRDIFNSGIVYGFTVDKNGVVYIADDYNVVNNQITTYIKAYDLAGNEIALYQVNGYSTVSLFCVDNGYLYYISNVMSENGFTPALFAYNIESTNSEELVILDMFSDNIFPRGIRKMECLNANIFIFGEHKNYVNVEPEYWEGDPLELRAYQYDGTVLMVYSIVEDNLEIIFDDTPHDFSVTPDNTLIVYAHDTMGGFYFIEVNPSDFSFGDKKYTHIGTRQFLQNFCTDDTGVLYSSGTVINYTTFSGESGFTRVVSNFALQGDIRYWGGYTFYTADTAATQGVEVCRIRNQAYITENQPIRLLGGINWENYIPLPGFNILPTDMSDYEFSLAILSLDTQYDMYLMQSYDSFAYNVRNKGSFYSLNDVPGVAEYLDACFPHIKAAATDISGNIWMLPIKVQADGIYYNINNCQSAELDITNTSAIDAIIESVKKASSFNTNSSNYSFDVNAYIKVCLLTYFRNNKVLDTPDFIAMSEMLKELYQHNGSWYSEETKYQYSSSYARANNPDFLFTVGNISPISENTFGYEYHKDNIRIASLTNDKNALNCYFICVNPNSKNLEYVLEFISAACEYLLTEGNDKALGLLSYTSAYENYNDNEYTQNCYSFFKNSIIDFNFLEAVLYDDFICYLEGELTLFELITRAEQKINMYLYE